MLAQNAHDTIDVEVLDRHAEVMDARRAGARLGERQEDRPVSDAQHDCARSPRLHRHAEEPLIKLQ